MTYGIHIYKLYKTTIKMTFFFLYNKVDKQYTSALEWFPSLKSEVTRHFGNLIYPRAVELIISTSHIFQSFYVFYFSQVFNVLNFLKLIFERFYIYGVSNTQRYKLTGWCRPTTEISRGHMSLFSFTAGLVMIYDSHAGNTFIFII